MRAVLLFLFVLPSCGGCGHDAHEHGDALPDPDDASIIDADPDGSVDAAPDALPDAPPDAAVDAPPLVIEPPCSGPSASCTTAPTTFIAMTSPKRVAKMARVGDSLYVSTYDLSSNGLVVASEVFEVNLTSGIRTSLITGTSTSFDLATAGGWAYAAEVGTANGAIWRFRPGVAPATIVTGRNLRGPVIADDVNLYWAESSASGDVIVRRALAGGSIDPIMACAIPYNLAVDDEWVYCQEFGQDLVRVLKDGTARMAFAYNTYQYTSMVHCDANLFVSTIDQAIYQVVTPFGPKTTFAAIPPPPPGRFYGITATAGHLFTTGNGVYRFDRTTAAGQRIVTESSESTPVAWNGQLFYFSRDVGIRRCVD